MIIIIVAMTMKGVIGRDNKLPWNIPEEMAHFRKLTQGSTVVMGRKTFESIGRPLPNRNNIIISRSELSIKGADVCHTVEEALNKAKSYNRDTFIIGGANIFEQTMPLADKMYISYIKKDYGGNIYFPAFDKSEWVIEKREDHPNFEFVVYRRKDFKQEK